MLEDVGGFEGHQFMMFHVVSLCVIPSCTQLYMHHVIYISDVFFGFHAQF